MEGAPWVKALEPLDPHAPLRPRRHRRRGTDGGAGEDHRARPHSRRQEQPRLVPALGRRTSRRHAGCAAQDARRVRSQRPARGDHPHPDRLLRRAPVAQREPPPAMKLWPAAMPGPRPCLVRRQRGWCGPPGDGAANPGVVTLKSAESAGRPWPRGRPARRAGISAPGRAPAWRDREAASGRGGGSRGRLHGWPCAGRDPFPLCGDRRVADRRGPVCGAAAVAGGFGQHRQQHVPAGRVRRPSTRWRWRRRSSPRGRPPGTLVVVGA